MTTSEKLVIANLLLYLRASLEYIDAIPKDVQLLTMPGFDRDDANNTISIALKMLS